MGSGYAGMGLYKQARALIEQARTINEALGARRTLAYNLLTLGRFICPPVTAQSTPAGRSMLCKKFPNPGY